MEREEVLYIVVPAYNEAENVNNVVEDWYPIIETHNGEGKSRLLIINDGSKDNTYEILSELAKTYPYLLPISKENSGHGPTLMHGYQYALEHDADYIFQTDSDGQTNSEEFEQFWDERKKYDALFGKRSERGDGKGRAFVEKILCKILKYYFHVNIPDSNAPFRLMKADYLREFLPKLPKNYNLPNVMLTTFGVYFQCKVKFITISFKPRQGGKNSINVKKIVKIGFQALKDFKKIKEQMSNEGGGK